MVERAAGAGDEGAAASERRLALPTVELMSLEVQMERQLRIGSGGTGGGGGGGGGGDGQRQHQQQAAPPAPAVGRPLAVLEYVLDGMPLPAFQLLVGMMGRF